jgi:hypothetical protein
LLSLIVSTAAYFTAAYFLKRYLDDNIGLPKGVTRSLTIFAGALAVAYGVAFIIDRIAG